MAEEQHAASVQLPAVVVVDSLKASVGLDESQTSLMASSVLKITAGPHSSGRGGLSKSVKATLFLTLT